MLWPRVRNVLAVFSKSCDPFFAERCRREGETYIPMLNPNALHAVVTE